MRILGIECASVTASAAVWEDGALLCEAFNATRLTHSQTLLPMVRDMLQNARLRLAEIDGLAVAAGPGSFTGLRIGIAAVKGMAMALDIPCAGVSTLEAMAYGLPAHGAVVLPVMDARCGQVYAAAFACENDVPRRLWEDLAVSIDELGDRLASLGQSDLLLVGDGARLCYDRLRARCPGLRLAPAQLRAPRAAGVCLAAAAAGRMGPARDLTPCYLRLPQAERELRARQADQKQATSQMI